jgi:glycosyltransferase involved in cell wall biosynthesis
MFRALVIEQGNNPSTDSYVLPALRANGFEIARYGFNVLPDQHLLSGSLLVFVRYIPTSWRRLLQQSVHKPGGIVLFIDDDVLDWRSATGTPWRYRWKLWRLSARHAGWLRKQGAALWVSTPYLHRKYANWSPQLVLPSSIAPDTPDPVRLFYHGSLSHMGDIRWLKDVVAQALAAEPRLTFELIGTDRIADAWDSMQRVTVVHPMAWSAYQSFAGLAGRNIGLVPLLDTPFNRARSYTKFFDITRSGAVGIYSDHPAYRDIVRDGVEGLVLPNTPTQWVEAILTLARDPDLHRRLLAAAGQRVSELNAQAEESYRGLALNPSSTPGNLTSRHDT